MSKVVKVVGAIAVGFMAGVLLAPKSGKETREEIRVRLTGAKAHLAEQSAEIRETVATNGQVVRTGVDDVSGEVAEFAKKAKGSAHRVGQEAKGLGKEAKGSAKRIGSTAKKTASSIAKDIKNSAK